MHARTRIVAMVLILVTTAGCLAAPGVGDANGETFDGDTVAADHQQALTESGSFTYDVEASVTVDGTSAGGSNLTAAVDLASEEVLVSSDTQVGPVTTYLEEGTAYQRIGVEEPEYRTFEPEVNASDVVRTDISPVVDAYSFEASGSDTLNGQQVTTYTAAETGANATLLEDFGDDVAVESVTVTLSVRDDGVVVREETQATLALEGGDREGTYSRTATYRDVGSTDVTAPDWLDAAASAGSADA